MKIGYEVIKRSNLASEPQQVVAAGQVDYSDDKWRRQFGRRCVEWLDRGYSVTTYKVAQPQHTEE